MCSAETWDSTNLPTHAVYIIDVLYGSRVQRGSCKERSVYDHGVKMRVLHSCKESSVYDFCVKSRLQQSYLLNCKFLLYTGLQSWFSAVQRSQFMKTSKHNYVLHRLWKKCGLAKQIAKTVLKDICLPLYLPYYISIFSRPGQSQGVPYKHCCYSLILWITESHFSKNFEELFSLGLDFF